MEEDKNTGAQDEIKEMVEGVGAGGGVGGHEDSGAGDENKDPAGAKGDYRTSFKKEYRDKIDIKKYPTLESFLESSISALEKSNETPATETDEAWAKVRKDNAIEDGSEGDKILASLKENGLGTKTADSVMSILSDFRMERDAELKIKKTEDAANAFTGLGELDPDFKANIKRGLAMLSGTHPDVFLSGKKRDDFTNPTTIYLLNMLGKANTEKAFPPAGANGKKSFDPLNPMGYKE